MRGQLYPETCTSVSETCKFDWHFHCLGTLYASEQLVLSAAKIGMVTDTSYLGPAQFCKFDSCSSSARWTIDKAKVGMEANGFFKSGSFHIVSRPNDGMGLADGWWPIFSTIPV